MKKVKSILEQFAIAVILLGGMYAVSLAGYLFN